MSWALEHFRLDVRDLICCDLGSHVGGFVDALLQAGAAKVYSVDTSYGTLAWTLRNDERVVVMERTNALHAELPEKVDFVSCDVGWTPQVKVLPKALSLLATGGRVLSLLKPQYEAGRNEIVPGKGLVKDEALARIVNDTRALADALCPRVTGPDQTPFLGGKGKNPEFFMLLATDPKSSPA